MLLESVKHAGSSFVTLTYNPENVPHVGKLKRGRYFSCEFPQRQTVNKYDTQRWLKRLRIAIAPKKIRYFLVAEYGDTTFRPHYHLALFGLDAITAGSLSGKDGIVNTTWGLGNTYVGELTPASAAYIAGYVTKKMTKKDDGRLHGREPEFARMSLRPGIGAMSMSDVVAALNGNSIDYFTVTGSLDVPSSLSMSSRPMPLGRYLRRVLRKELGMSPDAPPEAVKEYALKMRVMLEDYAKATKNPAYSPVKSIIAMNEQKMLNIEAIALLKQGAKKL